MDPSGMTAVVCAKILKELASKMLERRAVGSGSV